MTDLRSLGARSQAPFDPRVRPIAAGTFAQRPAANLVRFDRYGGSFYYATDVQGFFYSDGSAWYPLGSVVMDRANGTIDVNNGTSYTDIYSFSVPAGIMSTNRMLRLTVYGDFLNNTGASALCTPEVRFGGSAVWKGSTAGYAIATSAGRRPWSLVAYIGNTTAASQVTGGYFALGTATAGVTGIGTHPAAAWVAGTLAADGGAVTPLASGAASTVNTANAATIAAGVTLSVASTQLSFRKFYATLELL